MPAGPTSPTANRSAAGSSRLRFTWWSFRGGASSAEQGDQAVGPGAGEVVGSLHRDQGDGRPVEDRELAPGVRSGRAVGEHRVLGRSAEPATARPDRGARRAAEAAAEVVVASVEEGAGGGCVGELPADGDDLRAVDRV